MKVSAASVLDLLRRRPCWTEDVAHGLGLSRLEAVRLLEMLTSHGRFTVVVRGAPVLNDATLADARRAELDDFCEVISNGSDAPGTLVTDCSEEFRGRFEEADLIIAKGQGNYESLAGADKNIFFLFTIKCPVVSRALGAPVGSLMLRHQQPARAGPPAIGRQTTSAKPHKLKGATTHSNL